uniref:Uncharacterized protein n=1 Tax=Rhodnius prolixus TaxID=13249 RepID=T1HM75_RHOPR
MPSCSLVMLSFHLEMTISLGSASYPATDNIRKRDVEEEFETSTKPGNPQQRLDEGVIDNGKADRQECGRKRGATWLFAIGSWLR